MSQEISSNFTPKNNSRRLLLIGWDAADWNVINPLLEKGEMPALASLMERGCHGTLETLNPPLSPMLWTSIATGKHAYKHGIHGFSEPNPNGPGIRPISNISRKTKALWNILQHRDLKSNVIGWWPSHPAEPIDGVMVTNHYHTAPTTQKEASWPISPGTIHPARLRKHLAKLRFHPTELMAEHILPFVPRAAEIDQEKDPRLSLLGKTLAECISVNAAATAVIQNEPWDFMGVYYDAIDHFSHLFMRYHPPLRSGIKEEDFELYKDVMAGAYRFHDMMLESLLSLVDENTTVMLISDHGFHSDHLRPTEIPSEPAGPAAEHSPYGIFVMAGPGVAKEASGSSLNGASLLDITPTILHHFGLPVGEDMDGRVLEEVFENPNAIQTIPSWDEVDGECGLHTEDYILDPEASHAALEQMVALGYIEEPDEEISKAVEETRRELRYNLARSYMGGYRHIDAIPILRECWDHWPEESRFGIQLLQCHLSLGQAAAARDTLNLLVKRKHKAAKDAAEELGKLAETWKKAGKKTEDLNKKESRLLQKLQARASINPYAAKMLEGQVAYAEKDFETALEHFQEALKFNPEHAEVFIKMGRCLHHLDRPEDALVQYQKALETDSRAPMAHLGICRIHLRLNQPNEAEAAARHAITLQFRNPWGHYSLGMALSKQKKFPAARDALIEAVRTNPNFPQALSALAKLHLGPLRDPVAAFNFKGLENKAQQNTEAIKTDRLQPSKQPVSLRSVRFNSDYQPPERAILSHPVADSHDDSPEIDEQQTITIVTGLPRSGTSLMMNMLDAAGLSILTDGERAADEDNPRGYFEFTPATELQKKQDWLPQARGKVVKVVAQLLPYLPRNERYRFIFMERPLEEILRSQEKMLVRNHQKSGDKENLRNAYTQQIRKTLKHLDSLHLPLMRVPFSECLSQPVRLATELATFLNCDTPAETIAARVDPSLYRNKDEIPS
ncbi:MAG: alkaline phosphatase family protein [Akkermansiaceae bacterium]